MAADVLTAVAVPCSSFACHMGLPRILGHHLQCHTVAVTPPQADAVVCFAFGMPMLAGGHPTWDVLPRCGSSQSQRW